MAKSNIIRALEQLDKKDIYSLILFCLYKLKENPEYSILSELVYVLDNENFIKFINYFGGKTISVPSTTELNELVTSLLALEQVENSDKEIADILKDLGVKHVDKDKIMKNIKILKDILKEYDFKR